MADPLRSDSGEQKAPKSLFEEGQARLDAIVRSAMDGIITVDAAQRIVLFNFAAEKMFGVSAADVLGTPLERLIPGRYRVAHRAHIDRFINTGETSRRMGVQTPLSALRADGTEFRIDASISKAVVGDQLLLTVILRDITERLRAEESLRRALESVREGQSRLDAIVGSAMDAIVTVDEQQRVVLFNAAAEKMFGCSAA
ncbi:MAG TPA: PAS domain S-box protein, partial [Burkholderiaceae bacterium]|nr:PAS domain S-box protein [Burkholderiaceae bacterium]